MRNYETFSTTADAGIRFKGRNYSEFYANALRGLNLLLFARNSRPGGRGATVPFHFRGDGPENVLVNFLAEVLFRVYQENRRAAGIVVGRAGRNFLAAEMLLVPSRRSPRVEIKSVTYHNLHVQEKNGVLHASVVFDV